MLNITALSTIIINGVLAGYKVKADNDVRDVRLDLIMKLMKDKEVKFTNLAVNSSGNIVMLENDKPVFVERSEHCNSLSKQPVTAQVKSLSSNNDIDRMKQLVILLNKARKSYEQDDKELMSNKEYDALYDELSGLEKKLGTTMSNSPTVNVGYEIVSSLPKETHPEPMQSLEKTKELQDVRNFTHVDTVLSYKMDGLTVVLTYNNGELVKAVTRGNGTVGELVTNNARQFKNIPHRIPFKGELIVRGEAVITYKDFEFINNKIPESEAKYKNPRNLASGSVRQLDSRITASRNVRFVAFKLVSASGMQLDSVYNSFKFLSDLGFEIVKFKLVNRENVIDSVNSFTNYVKDGKLEYPVDGLVLVYNNIKYGKSLGSTAKTPRDSLALKWEDEVSETVLKDIEWSPSKTGLLNPVAIFEPVDIEGSTVARASLHNVSILKELELGIGDKITVYKANMIIPQVDDNLTRSNTYNIPRRCPVCGCETVIHVEPSSGVKTLYCPNELCLAKGNSLFAHFVSRDAMNVVGISDSILETLISEEFIDPKDYSSLYHLDDYEEDIIDLDGFGVTSYNKMIKAIDASRRVKVPNLIYALSIPNVGLQTAKIISKHFNNDIDDITSASVDELMEIDGIGDTIAESVYDYFSDEENFKVFTRLLDELDIITESSVVSSGMEGVTICVTGAVEIFSSRNQVKDIVESMGGKLTGSVSKSTNYLVTNDITSGSNKNRAAAQYGIPILTEKEFIDKFNIKV